MLYTRYTKLVVAVSDAVRVKLIGQGVPEDRIKLIHDGVDIRRFRPRPKDAHLMEQLGLSKDHFVIGSSGWLGSRSFNCKTLIHAIQELVPQYRDVRLLLIGRGAEKVAGMIEELNLTNRVILPGFTDDMPAMLSLIDLHVQPNSMAALSTAMLEAMAMGKPAVATRVGGHPEVVVDGETGRLCPPGNPKAMSEVIAGMIENRDKLSGMGWTARERVENLFDVDQMTRELEKMYSVLIGGGQ